MPVKNLKGVRFGHLLVVTFVGVDDSHNAMWECVCDCGKVKVASSMNLRKGSTRSCGCLRKTNKNAETHGHTSQGGRTRTYKSWHYAMYRGGGVCEHWRSFDNFLADMGEQPDGAVLRRIYKTRPHSKENSIWFKESRRARS